MFSSRIALATTFFAALEALVQALSAPSSFSSGTIRSWRSIIRAIQAISTLTINEVILKRATEANRVIPFIGILW
jgi:hypothetical protein